MTCCYRSMGAPLLLCCLLAVTLASADDRAPLGGAPYSPGPRYAYGPSPPPPSAFAAPTGGAYGPYGPPHPVGPYGYGSAQPNQRFLLGPIKGILDKFNPFNKGGYPSGPFGLPVPFGDGFPNPFAGLCNPGGAYNGKGGGYVLPLPPGYKPPSSDDAYIPPHSSGNRPVIIYTRPSVKSPTYSRPSDDRPSHDAPHHEKQMLTSRPHPLYG